MVPSFSSVQLNHRECVATHTRNSWLVYLSLKMAPELSESALALGDFNSIPAASAKAAQLISDRSTPSHNQQNSYFLYLQQPLAEQ